MYPIQPQMQIQIVVEIYNTNQTIKSYFNFEILSNIPIIHSSFQVLTISFIPLTTLLNMNGISLNIQAMMLRALNSSSSDHSFLYNNGVYLFHIICEERDSDRNTLQDRNFYKLTCKVISHSMVSNNLNWNKGSSFSFELSEVHLEFHSVIHSKQACNQNEK